MKHTPKIRDFASFLADPDAAISAYELPKGKKSTRQILDPKIYLGVLITANTKSEPRKEYYVMRNGTLEKCLGNARNISYREARRAAAKYLSTAETASKGKKKDPTLRDVWLEVYENNADYWSEATKNKYKKSFNARFGNDLGDMPIRKITHDMITKKCDELRKKKIRAAFDDMFKYLSRISLTAQLKKYIEHPLFPPEIKKNYSGFKGKGGYGKIQEEEQLIILIRYIQNYKNVTVRNALIFGLCTGMRPMNIRGLKRENLKLYKKFNTYYLHYTPDEMKIAENGDEYLGIPDVFAEWIKKLPQREDSVNIFSGKRDTLSDMTLANALKSDELSENGIKIVAHSFRKILSTFANENFHEKLFSTYDVERVLAHRVKGVAGIYNKAKNIKNTLQVMSWWINYLIGLGLNL